MKMNKKNLLQGSIVLVFLAVLVLLINKKPSTDIVTKQTEESIPEKTTNIVSNQINIAGQTLNVELATTLAEQNRGLSGRNELKDNEAMLFVFDSPGQYSFWMKDMNFPIDMIWIGSDNTVIYIKKNATPESYPESFTPKKNSLYVLETVSGFSEKNGLKVGDPVEFTF